MWGWLSGGGDDGDDVGGAVALIISAEDSPLHGLQYRKGSGCKGWLAT